MLKKNIGDRVLATLLMGGSVVGMIKMGVIESKLVKDYSANTFAVAAIVVLGIFVLYAWTCFNGVRLWRGDVRGWKWAVILFTSQAPIFTIDRLSYHWYAGLSFKIMGGHVSEFVSFVAGAEADFFLHSHAMTLVYGVNLVAVFAVVYLLTHRPIQPG